MADSERRSFLVTAVESSGSVYGTILANSIVVAPGYKGGNALPGLTSPSGSTR